jgi:mevalonate kinase
MILHGAKALAVPLVRGQVLELTPKKDPGQFHWIAMHDAYTWFETTLNLDNLEITATSNRTKSENLVNIFHRILEIQPEFIEKLRQYDVITRLEFDPSFGFGSSSTLTSLLAQWAGVDPLQLHFRISRGSGYDVACASAESAILYQVFREMPVIESVDFLPPFMDRMWLVYLGEKQDSSKSVATFLNNYLLDPKDIERFSRMTTEFVIAQDLHQLGAVIVEHEQALSEILNMPVLKADRFPDLEGHAKYLGAWGGDFALLVTDWSPDQLSSYLSGKGIDQWFAYKELVY